MLTPPLSFGPTPERMPRAWVARSLLSPPPSCVQREPILLPPSPPISPQAIFNQLSNQVQHRISNIKTELQLHHVSPANFEALLMLHAESPIVKGITLPAHHQVCATSRIARVHTSLPPKRAHRTAQQHIRHTRAPTQSWGSCDR